METVITKTIKSSVDGITFGYWDNEAEVFVPLNQDTEIPPELGANSVLVGVICDLVEQIKESVKADLVDVWNRLDKIEVNK